MGAKNSGIKFKVERNSMDNNVLNIVHGVLPKNVYFTAHAKAQQTERHFKISITEIMDMIKIDNLLEVQVTNSNTIKYLFRCNVNCIFDVVFVLTKDGAIVTNWLNNVSDNHVTRDNKLYTTDTTTLVKILQFK